MQIPAILLEGDEPGSASPRIAAGLHSGQTPPLAATPATASLPDAYGTQRLQLTARDPNWIHAHWDFTRDQLHQARTQAEGGPLILRLFQQSTQGALVSETRVHPESVRWFLHTPQPNIPHVAEIGYYNKHRGWSVLAASNAVRTPPAGPSADRGFELATLAPNGEMERHGTIKEWAQPGGLSGSGTWRDEHNLNSLNPAGTNSLTDASGSWDLALSSPGIRSWSLLDSPSSLSSPQGGACPPAFRLAVDAELTVYGSTDPAAGLQIGDQSVPLAADGSFRFRFAFPDGLQFLPIKAISAETGEQRTVELRFSRHTKAGG